MLLNVFNFYFALYGKCVDVISMKFCNFLSFHNSRLCNCKITKINLKEILTKKNKNKKPPQDCASGLHFTYYFDKTLKPASSNKLADHPYAEQNVRSNIPNRITEHTYCVINQKDQIDVDMKYAVTLAR